MSDRAREVDRNRRSALNDTLHLRGDYSLATLQKLRGAERWLDDVTQVDADPSVFRVKSWNSDEYRRVQVISDNWIICSCANGRHAGGNARCYHAAMVELLLSTGGVMA